MSFSEILFLALIITFASFTQGLSGFGGALVSLPFLALFMDIKTVVPFLNLLGLCANAYLFFHLHQHIPWKKLPILLLSSIPGIFIGAYILKFFPTFFLQILLGIILILFPLYEIFWKPVKKEADRRWEYPVGFLSGFLQGSMSANGPPMMIYLSFQPWKKNTIKAICASFFFFHNVGVAISHTAVGLITPTVIRCFLIGIPAIIFGTFLGHLYYQKISESLYRKIIIYLLLLSGILTLYKAFA